MDSGGLDYQAATEAAVTLISTWGLRVVGAVALLIVGWIVARTIRASVRRALERARTDATLVPFFASLAYYAALTFVVLAVLSLFGIQTTSLVAVLGAVGLAVGLSLQGTLSNFAAGVMLLVFRPFQVGDFIDAGGTAGSVREISIFNTVLDSPDNVRIIVPNGAVYGSTIKNFATNPTRRNDLIVGVSYDDDLSQAVEVIRRVLADDKRVLADPEPTVAVGELADSSVNLVVRPWCAKGDYWALRWDLTRRFKEELERNGCSIPFPQTDVHLHSTDQGAA